MVLKIFEPSLFCLSPSYIKCRSVHSVSSVRYERELCVYESSDVVSDQIAKYT